jgi:F-type H+-transporting ATPase subunit delta
MNPAMNDQQRGYAIGAAGIAAHRNVATQLAGELAELVRVLEQADELRWALTDSSVATSQRRAIVEELLTGKLGDLAVRLASFVVGVTSPGDTVECLSWVADFIAGLPAQPAQSPADYVLGLDEEAIGPTAGRHATRARVSGYAAAIFASLRAEGRLEEIEDELFRFARVVETNGELRRALSDWGIPARIRAAVAVDLLRSKCDPVTSALVAFAIRAGGAGSLVAMLDWLVERAAQERNGRVGELRVAVPVQAEQSERLRRAVSRAVGHDVELREVVDPSVIGGAQVTVGDLVVDGTVRRKLALARTDLIEAL